jgi:endonuclease/exonuclease/phosphatase family metal-dependent hydrolase
MGLPYLRKPKKITMIKVLQKTLLVLTGLLSAAVLSKAQVSVTALNSPYTENFNTLLATGTTNDISTLPAGWTFVETGTNANTTYAAGTGSSNAGNTYSLGLDATDRALGGLQSGSLIPSIGAGFTNNTGATITELIISYTGEQWRLGATPRAQADRLDFQWSLDATSLTSGTWTDIDNLDFVAPIIAGTVGALNGNASSNRASVSFTISGLLIPSGSSFWIRWNDFNVASSDDALAVDDFSLTAAGIPSNQPSFSFTPSSLNFGEINLGSSRVLAYVAEGSNLEDSLTTITSLSSSFLLSLDQVNFSDTLVIADTATVYVRFSPLANGAVTDSLLHSNGSLSKSFAVSGSGYDPISNIISIAEARGRSAGSKVTVTGRITASNQFGSPSYVQDSTGGIPVFDFALSQQVNIGDTIIVTGPIGVFNDQKQISGAGITFSKPDSSTRILAPKPILINELAANEGRLVTVQQVELLNKSFVFYPQSTERMTNGATQADLRIDGDTNIPGLTKPQGVVDITGVVGRFRANAQLLPRFREDIPGVANPTTPVDSIPKSTTFDVVTWNLEFFGAEREDYPDEFGPADEPLQLENVRSVISSLQADVIAVQEVSSDSLFNVLVSQLPGYKAVCSDRYSRSFEGPSSDFPPQKVCFIYDSTTVNVLSHRAMFESLYDSARTIDPSLLPAYPTGDPSSFWSSGRLPYLLTANVTINGVTERINFVNIHAKSGSTVADFNRRVYDAQVLKDSLAADFSNEQVVILGDFNDDLDQSIVSGRPSSYGTFVTDTASYVPVTRALSLAGAKSTVSFNDMIDHQIISNELQEEYLALSEQVITPFASIPNYGNTTSDHLPVVVRYEFISPVASLVNAFDIVNEDTDSVLVQVQLSRSLLVEKTLTFAIQSGSSAEYGIDFTTQPSAIDSRIALTIPAGSTTASLLIQVADDTRDEANESVVLQLLSTEGIVTNDSTVYSLTILDNDLTTIQFTETAVSREEGSGAYNVTLSLSSALDTARTIVVRAINSFGVLYGNRWDYTTTPSVSMGRIALTIPAGASEVSFAVTPNNDIFRERRPETITFSIESAGGLQVGDSSSLVFTIIDVRPCIPVFGVFPNPTFGQVNIITVPGNEGSLVSGILYDPAGVAIATGEGTTAQLSELFTNALQGKRRGFYLLRLIQCNEVINIRILKL